MKIIDSTVTKKGAIPEGLKYSYLLSVDNETAWVDPINTVVNFCNDLKFVPVPNKKNKIDYNDYWDCYEKIPLYVYDVIECSFAYN